MYYRRLAATALAAALALSLTACSSDSKKSDTTATTKADSKGGSSTTAAGPATTSGPTTTISAEEFNANADKFQTELDAAGDNFCKITAAVSSFGASEPTTADQAKTIFLAFADILDKVADNLPTGSTANADVLHRAATEVRTEANDPNLDPKKVTGGPKALSEPDVVTAMAAVSDDIAKNCDQKSTTTGG